ncbi:MAG: S41 family peptidase [Cytophagaceae bacterium]|nr:S41 family peptidase [Cytophagaceae bacterium]
MLLGLALAGGILLGATLFGGGSKSTGDILKNFNKYREVMTWIDHSYVDSVDTDSLVDFSIKKMLEKLDPHSVYIPAAEVAFSRSQLDAGFDGIGVEFNIFSDTVYVVNTMPGGPSEAAGVRAGDKLLRADGTPLTGSKLDNKLVFSKLRGPRGSQVTLDVQRRGVRDLIKFTVARNRITSYSVTAGYLIDDKTGYIKINSFSESTFTEFRNVLSGLKNQGMERLMLDLRGNGGGYKDRATNLVDELLSGNRLIVYTDGKGQQYDDRTFAKREGSFEKGPVMVLIDENSASASEIVAGALQDNDRALIVGRRSYGKGLVQSPINLSDGSELRLTVSRYFTPSGRCIQKPYSIYDKDDEMRLKSGELFHADSIKFDPNRKFKTVAGRTVYGGGGITPDVFIPADTNYLTKYLRQLYNKNLVQEYALNYAEDHRKALEKQSFKQYLDTFVVSDAMLNELVKLAAAADVKRSETDLNRSRAYLQTQIKALIARQVWEKRNTNGLRNEYFRVMTTVDNTYQQALRYFDQAEVMARK